MTTNTIPVSFQTSEQGSIKIFSSIESGANDSVADTNTFARLSGVTSWSDSELISAVRCDPPNEAALDVLVARYWGHVFGRCQMLTLNREKALDLAQTTWHRLLRSRHSLKPDGNFRAYLNMISTNLFRDSYRAARRAGPMADYRLESLDAVHSDGDGETVLLVDSVPDLKSMQPEEQTLLAMDIDQALAHLTPQLREVLVARLIDGESCAEIALRHGRTEQTVSGWVREALRQMKTHLEEPGPAIDCESPESGSESSASRFHFQVWSQQR